MISRPAARRAGAAAVAAVALATGCAKPPQKKGPVPVAVDVASLRRGSIATYDRLDGQVTPYLQSSLATQQAGTIVAEYANEGDRVHAGEVLARIDDSPLRATLEQEQGSALSASAKLSQSQIQQPITNQQYQSELEQANQTYLQAVQQRSTDVAALKSARLTYRSNQELVSQGYVARTAFEITRSRFVAAEKTLDQDDAKIIAAKAAVDQAKRNLLNTPLQQQVVAENRGSLAQARGAVTLTQTNIAETTLTAPFDGVVTSRLLDPGAYASPTQPLFQVSQLDPVYVDVNVPQADLPYATVGTLVSFRVDGGTGRRYDARVTSVNSVPTTGTLLYRARLTVPNPDLALKGGLLVTVRLVTADRRDVLLAPRSAVEIEGDAGNVYVVERASPAPAGGDAPSPAPGASAAPQYVARNVAVGVGLQTDRDVEVSSPKLRSGMRIVTNRVGTLHDGVVVAPHS